MVQRFLRSARIATPATMATARMAPTTRSVDPLPPDVAGVEYAGGVEGGGEEGAPLARTTKVPFMTVGWYMQKYGKLPTVFAVKVRVVVLVNALDMGSPVSFTPFAL